MAVPRIPSSASRRRQAGQSFIEYFLVTVLAVIVLASPLAELSKAIRQSFTNYSFAMSISTIPGLDRDECSGSKKAAGVEVKVDACTALTDVLEGHVPDSGSVSVSISIAQP